MIKVIFRVSSPLITLTLLVFLELIPKTTSGSFYIVKLSIGFEPNLKRFKKEKF